MLRAIRLLARAFAFGGALGLVAMMLHVNVDVVGKALFDMPAPATLEVVSYYYMAAVAMLPLAAMERKGGLVHVDLLYQHLPDGVRRGLLVATLALSAMYCAGISWAAWEPAVKAWRVGAYTGTTVTVATWPTRFLPVAGFALIAVMLLAQAVAVILGRADLQAEVGKGE
tara:strand:+ start:205 stop:714 length:510 start_codon:yes stop_codon:yes gene_type:complete